MYFEDSLVRETASKLKNAIESGQPGSVPYLEALTGVLGHELCRVHDEVVRTPAANRGGLAGWQSGCRRLHRTASGRTGIALQNSPTLRGSASITFAGRSNSRSSSAASIPGAAAHGGRQVAAGEPTNSVTDIAFSLGYAQISSFSSAFRKATGWTPTVYRREFE